MAYREPSVSEPDSANPRDVIVDRRATPDFDLRGRPLLYFTHPFGAYCPECVRLGVIPYGRTVADAVPRSRGIGGRCDGCNQLCRVPQGPEPACVADELSRALNAHDPVTLEDGWATTRRPAPSAEAPAVVELFWGNALYRCVVERVA